MKLKNLKFENIIEDAKSFIVTENDSYSETYPEFLKYFEKIEMIEKHHLIISSHFAYGWMPTIINLDTTRIDKVLFLLNAVKSGHLLDKDEILIIKNCINNSLVGTSKLLHFIKPENYAIWDSRIFRYLTEKKSDYGIGNPEYYLEYIDGLKIISENVNYETIHSLISRNFDYPLYPTRVIEIIMFETDRKNQYELKNNRK
ncbi:hypothetical protein K8354_07200 [Polaribacter litorisediminis]|uniref:hypothetical protein n=1 Tax=Polaribacter litorisediminis TaxID=1908341 RepID=UPI001CBFDC17|nr:hypothetical protein [Polaribacter litorisediminis]UAM99582.1 hypothetical protein K8354_07200 [Polaribacter litorisediminis]